MHVEVPPAEMLLFAAVVREGSFTKAARAAGLTKQTVSARIARLEERLGVRLLERTTRRMRVTAAGNAYAQRCAAIASSIDEANAEVLHRRLEPTGLLRISTPVLYGRRFLAPVVAGHLRAWPRTRVEVVLADRRVDLIEENIDLAIRVGDLDDSSLTARKIGVGLVRIVASPSFMRRHELPSSSIAWAQARCIAMRATDAWWVQGRLRKIDPVLVVNDLESLRDAAIAGVGIASLPSLVCDDAIAAGRLVELFGAEPKRARPVYVVYPSRRLLPAHARVFINRLAAVDMAAPARRHPALGARRR